VLTTVAVDDPVVGVLHNAKCGAVRVSRRFVLLADPPELTQEPQTAAVSVPAFAAVPVDVPAAAGDGPAVAAPDGSVASADTSPVALGGAPSAPAQGRSAPIRQVGAAAPAPAARSTRRAERKSALPRDRAARPAQRAPAPAAPALEATSRLRLEPAELQQTTTAAAVDSALAAVAQAASAARAAASAASVAAARIASLEGEVDGLRKEAVASRELATQLRERLARDDRAGRWTWPLVSLALLLAVLAAWLAWRLNAADRTRQREWQTAAPPEPAPGPELTPSKLPTAPIPFVTSELSLPGSAPTRDRPLHAWPAPAPVDTLPPPLPANRTSAESRPDPDRDSAMQRTEVLPPQSAIDGAAARDVSIEELIDLEQQAEFFVVLGQDDAAIELLAEHLRNTGGGSPLPYLKLLEIYHRRGENEHYERIRMRFNQRFNAYAPAWGVDLQAGRSLDSYPGVVPRLQQVWSRPLDAMAELEALLFGRSQGALFDLPAYREVLFLYSLARDLLNREDGSGGSVDLLLPLSDGSRFGSTSPVPFATEILDDATPGRTVEQRSLSPLDFDLSVDSSAPTSLFGTPDGTPDRPSRR
jgi:hypothetical protein